MYDNKYELAAKAYLQKNIDFFRNTDKETKRRYAIHFFDKAINVFHTILMTSENEKEKLNELFGQLFYYFYVALHIILIGNIIPKNLKFYQYCDEFTFSIRDYWSASTAKELMSITKLTVDMDKHQGAIAKVLNKINPKAFDNTKIDKDLNELLKI